MTTKIDLSTTPIGERLKKHRIAAGLSQINFAKKAGFTQAAISYFEKGQRPLSPDDISKFATILNISVKDLAGSDANFEQTRLMRNSKGLSTDSLKKINEYVELVRKAERKS